MSDEVKDVAAFPREGKFREISNSCGTLETLVKPQDGMTLREFFAAATLVGMLRNDFWNEHRLRENPEFAADIATDCYTMADAMIKAGNRE